MALDQEKWDAISAKATELGIDPVDLATAIAYETRGTFDPHIGGPVTDNGHHFGIIQFGDKGAGPRYGVTRQSTFQEQLDAAGRYLTDAGVRPGSSFRDVYTAINAGRAGRNAAEYMYVNGEKRATGRTSFSNAEKASKDWRGKVEQLAGGFTQSGIRSINPGQLYKGTAFALLPPDMPTPRPNPGTGTALAYGNRAEPGAAPFGALFEDNQLGSLMPGAGAPSLQQLMGLPDPNLAFGVPTPQPKPDQFAPRTEFAALAPRTDFAYPTTPAPELGAPITESKKALDFVLSPSGFGNVGQTWNATDPFRVPSTADLAAEKQRLADEAVPTPRAKPAPTSSAPAPAPTPLAPGELPGWRDVPGAPAAPAAPAFAPADLIPASPTGGYGMPDWMQWAQSPGDIMSAALRSETPPSSARTSTAAKATTGTPAAPATGSTKSNPAVDTRGLDVAQALIGGNLSRAADLVNPGFGGFSAALAPPTMQAGTVAQLLDPRFAIAGGAFPQAAATAQAAPRAAPRVAAPSPAAGARAAAGMQYTNPLANSAWGDSAINAGADPASLQSHTQSDGVSFVSGRTDSGQAVLSNESGSWVANDMGGFSPAGGGSWGDWSSWW